MSAISTIEGWLSAIPLWLSAVPWAKVVYTVVLVTIALILLYEVKRLWWNERLYVGRFSLIRETPAQSEEETDLAARVVFWHRELRHHFAQSSGALFSAEAGLSPTVATPIEEPESVLSELSITVQSINVTDILSKLRKWVSAPREITGDVVQIGNDYRATVQIGDGITRLADGTEIGPSIHLPTVAGKDRLAFEIACGLVWRQAGTGQAEIAAVSMRDFCNWANAWVAFLKFDAKSRQLEGLSTEDQKELQALRTQVSKILEAPEPYLRFLDLRANVDRLLLEFETDDLKRRDLTAEMQEDRFRYLVRLKVDPRASTDLDALKGSPDAMKIFAGMRPALPLIAGKLDYGRLSALDAELKTTDFAGTWQKILADGTETIESAGKALGVMRIREKGASESGTPELGFVIGDRLVYGLAFTLPPPIRKREGPVVVTFDPGEWEAEFWFSESLMERPEPALRITRAVYFAPNQDGSPSPALFELADHDVDARPALAVHPAAVDSSAGGNYIAVIGYHMPDAGLPKALVPSVLGTANGIKRAAPGRLRAISAGSGTRSGLIYANRLTFEAMTMAGTAGGPLIDLHTRRLIGVNYAGVYQGAGEKLGYALPVTEMLPLKATRDVFTGAGGQQVTFDALLPAVEAEIAARTAEAATASASPIHIPEDAGAIQRLEAFGQLGYQDNFLGVPLELPKTPEGAPVLLLDYLHATVVLNPKRRLAWYAVANVDGAKLHRVERPRRSLVLDPRTPSETQTSPEIYKRSALDRGHLLSRHYMAWGDQAEAREASLGAFLAPNIVPQHERLNRRAWLGVETLVRDYVEAGAQRATVVAGPVMLATDPVFRGERIPQSFWKILVTASPKGKLRASGFLLRQSIRVTGTEIRAVVPDFDPVASRVSIAEIEEMTGIDFGPLRHAPSVF